MPKFPWNLWSLSVVLAANEPNNFFVGFVIGSALIGFIWFLWYLIVRARLDIKHYEKWSNGYLFSTKSSYRVFGISGEKILNGKLVWWAKSLWACPRYGKPLYFFLYLDEIHTGRIYPVTANIASKFIVDHTSSEVSAGLLKDWFSEKVI